jgi:hypothetical protein
MKHEEIRHKLSEFIDGAITPGEKAEIEQHLKACTECADALREIRKTIEYIHAIEEVESPAWMTQKIMAKVREEHEAKNTLWQRVFIPLFTMFPVQAVAVVFLAVTAYFIYTNINPAQKYTEEPVGMLAKKEAPAVQRMKEENKTVREAAPEAKQDSRKPGYKSLDMKYEYEKPAAPVPAVPGAGAVATREESAASAPAPAKRESQMYAQDKADLEKRAAAPKANAVEPSFMAEQAAPAAEVARSTQSREMSTAQRDEPKLCMKHTEPSKKALVKIAKKHCKDNPKLSGECFTIHGRLRSYNGNPTLRLWKTGTTRILGISQGEHYDPEYWDIPESVSEQLTSFYTEITGDFYVCPLTSEREGKMQFICIERVTNSTTTNPKQK